MTNDRGTHILAVMILIFCAMDAPGQMPEGQPNPIQQGANQKEALKVHDSIYMGIGFGNTFMVVTDEGNVIIDTSIVFQASKHKRLLTEVSDAPVKYIVLTHGHGDHTGGVKLWKEEGTEVIAQNNFVEFMHYQERLKGFFGIRNAAQFGRGAPGALFSGAGADGVSPGNYASEIVATILFDKEYSFELGGLTFQVLHTPGETYDHATVWIPELKAAFVGDNFYDSFPNMYTLRGTKPRWALDYVEFLNRVLELKPEILLPSHGMPRHGNAKITEELTRYRDAILYVHDATVKGMNEGKDVYTLMQEVKLPSDLDVGEAYGRVSWSVRGIYEGYVGWFDAEPITMFDVPAAAAYSEVVDLAGGAERVAERAMVLIDGGEALKGLRLAQIALEAEPDNKIALGARLAGLKALLAESNNFNETSWLMYGIGATESQLK